jgi:hypothetical protein
MGDMVPFSRDWRDVVNAQLGELNDSATATLDQGTPAPDGLPPTGSWIRVVKLDDDLLERPETPWHCVVGWDKPIGCLSIRCRRRPGRGISHAVSVHVGQPNGDYWWLRRRPGFRLRVEHDRPAGDVCRQCMIGLDRDVAREGAAERAAELERLVGLLPSVQAIAIDPRIDDGERGRRLRELWPR